ncbi:ROK family protein [Paenibacillus filicis]|uniref:ROK family protein n=1 Tax=Paenibacillus filicis TaxID=669464 RepID=A0ABU9DPR9_9BACL
MSATRKKRGTNLEDVQDMNRSLIIKLLRKKQICSRAELTQESGLNQSTITHIINEFIQWGLVVETGSIEGRKGRRSIGIRLNSELYKIIGVRLTRKSIFVALYDIEGQEYEYRHIAIDNDDDPLAAFGKIKDLISMMIRMNASGHVYAIGVALPGPLFRQEGRIALMSSFPGWDKINIEQELMQEYGIPVYIEHDAKAGGLAQWWFGDHQLDPSHGVLMYVTAGQGIGAGIIVNGKVYHGAIGMAGEMGHMSIDYNGPVCECGHRGCLELYCTTSVLLKELNRPYSALSGVWESLREGHPATVQAVKKVAWFLGFGLANMVNVYNPDHIVLGDELSGAGELLRDTVAEVIREHVLIELWQNLRIELASPDKDDMLIGAAAHAIDQLLMAPSSLRMNL